ncbi:MAG: hypothetical protein BWK76_20815 [Desulfobulbaceae bacterium A2]|nr:MAG: hypothetical protein BWK76_20815 [Desulfobulbaceae bacterium A2]
MQDPAEQQEKTKQNTTASRIGPGFEAGVAAVCMGLMTAIVFANVVVRYLTNVSLAFSEEFAVFLMLAMTLFGASAAAARGHHIRITVLIERLRPGLRRPIELGAALVAAATFAVLAVLSGWYTYDIWRFEDVSPGLGIPMWLYWLWVPLLSAAVTLRILGHALREFRGSAGEGHHAR